MVDVGIWVDVVVVDVDVAVVVSVFVGVVVVIAVEVDVVVVIVDVEVEVDADVVWSLELHNILQSEGQEAAVSNGSQIPFPQVTEQVPCGHCKKDE